MAIWGSVVLVLLIPLVAMQFTDEVDWDLMDFIVAGALLTFAALAYELASRKLSNSKYRLAVGIAILAVLIIVWIELAVGLF
ncbi:MAG: hypothetical protein HQ556_05085 [Candidatus Marinimicrobia bacterium]|nr:hypothetical protein [Candidatus Neomarinimicrobiota bacterium]